MRLFDFGLAQLEDADTLTAVGDVPGTLAYIPPERLHGEAAGPPADVWAVGVLLWEAFAGHHPFWRTSPLETGEEIKTGAPSIREARPDLPDRLISAVDAALSVDPAGRPKAAALARELRDAWWERSPRKARSRPKARLRLEPRRILSRSGPPALAALAAGWIASSLPFYPASWPVLLAAAAGALTALRARAGLAFALAVPVFPLGNLSFGLAVLYAAFAVAWLALMWGDARRGLLFCTGLLLGPVGLLGLMPIVALQARGFVRRGAHAGAAVLLAGCRCRDSRPHGAVHGRGRCAARDRVQRASRGGAAGDLAMAAGDACARARGGDPGDRGCVAPARGPRLRPDDRLVRGALPGGDADRCADGERAAARALRMGRVRRAHRDVEALAGANRAQAHTRRTRETDMRAFPG